MLYYPRRSEPTGSLTCVDLFAGAGGLAEGFRQAGFSILAGVDSDAAAGKTFRENFPEAHFYGIPAHQLDPKKLMRDCGVHRGDLDCLIGGPPCQAFSYNNHQRSETDFRAGLFRDYLDVLKALRPKTLVMENVPGILTVGDGAVLDEIRESLTALGYEVEVRILYAEEFGVPQERRRVFFVGTTIGHASALLPSGQYLPIPKPSIESNPFVHRWERQPSVTYGSSRSIRVWPAIGDLPPLGNGGGHEVGSYGSRRPRTVLQRILRGDQEVLYNHIAPKLSQKTLERITCVPEGGSWRDIPFEMLPAGMQRAKRSCHTKRYGRLERGGRCCTILTKLDPHWGSYIHPTQHRTISIREAARLQSFPDRFRFFGYKSQQMEQVGNAVPPLLAKAIGSAVGMHLRQGEMPVETTAA